MRADDGGGGGGGDDDDEYEKTAGFLGVAIALIVAFAASAVLCGSIRCGALHCTTAD